ncbi:MAG: pyruvate kinase [Desulfuromonadales bacterium]|nr:pyruvate kinase [Desulfuromonadales bacterium]
MEKCRRKTKIVATLGPVSSSYENIKELVDAGVDIFRLNFSHGTNSEKEEVIENIRKVNREKRVASGILADLQGPKIRTGRMENGAILLKKGEKLVITTKDVLGREGLISTTYKSLLIDVKPGSKILMDDGLIELKVQSVEGENINCTVIEGGILKDLKGINLPGVDVSSPSLTEKDRKDLMFCLEKNVDYIALSFVRKAEDLVGIKQIINDYGKNTPVVAKIEKPEAIRNFRSILKVADAVMVARGDLGVEINAEKVPMIQKKIIKACNEVGKPVITATQMLESMIQHPRPTRAETSDVANAILDGTDAIMLSGETASGMYPVEAVRTMSKVAIDVEGNNFQSIFPFIMKSAKNSIASAVAEGACMAAAAVKAKAIVVFTQSGGTAALISRLRPSTQILAFTPSEEIRLKLNLYWGVCTNLVGKMNNSDQQIELVEKTLLETGFKAGDVVVITMGVPLERKGSTNLMKVHQLGMHS